MVRDALLAFGLILSTATQLRIAGVPLGLGEMFLSVWLVSAIGTHLTRLRIAVNGPMMRLLSFWLGLVISLSLGAVMGMRTELFFDVDSIIHDSVAYLLLTGLACMMATELADPARLQRVAWYVVLIGSASMLLLLADGQGWIDIPADRSVVLCRLQVRSFPRLGE